jgi:hypothetical protein
LENIFLSHGKLRGFVCFRRASAHCHQRYGEFCARSEVDFLMQNSNVVGRAGRKTIGFFSVAENQPASRGSNFAFLRESLRCHANWQGDMATRSY